MKKMIEQPRVIAKAIPLKQIPNTFWVSAVALIVLYTLIIL